MLRVKYKININEARDILSKCVFKLDSELNERASGQWDSRMDSTVVISLANYADTEICLAESLINGFTNVKNEDLASYAKEAAEGILFLVDRRSPLDKTSPIAEALSIFVQIAEAEGLILQDKGGATYFASLREVAESIETGYIWACNGLKRSCEFFAELEHMLHVEGEWERAQRIAMFLEEEEERAAGDRFNTGTLKLALYEDTYVNGVSYGGSIITGERRKGRIYLALTYETEEGVAASSIDLDEVDFFKLPSDDVRKLLDDMVSKAVAS